MSSVSKFTQKWLGLLRFSRTPSSTTMLRSSSEKKHRASLAVTALESREVPADLSGGILTIEGTTGRDVVSIDQIGSVVVVLQNDAKQIFHSASVTSGQVRFRGNDGDDVFSCSAPLRVYAEGGKGNDSITGSSLPNTILGGHGSDTLIGGANADRIDGRNGITDNQVMLRNGPDNDVIFGLQGNDTIDGQVGNDTILGGPDTDSLMGGRGNDRISGNDGSDRIDGGDGDDWLIGCTDYNAFERGGANDTILGGNGNVRQNSLHDTPMTSTVERIRTRIGPPVGRSGIVPTSTIPAIQRWTPSMRN